MATKKATQADAAQLKITLVRSVIGRPEKHRKVLLAMGLKRTHRSVVLPDTPIIRGMIKKVSHLIQVEAA